MLLWYREDKNRSLEKDIELAIARFKMRFGDSPAVILVRPTDENEFQSVDCPFNIKTDKYINERCFGLL